MDYHTSKKKLVLPEYGRNVQNMVDHIKTIEDREQRNLAARSIINIMGNLNPHLRDIGDFKHKLWDHLAIMSEFNLDIDWPYEVPKKEDMNIKPKKLDYNSNNIRYRYYGKIIQNIISKVADMEDSENKEALIESVLNHMKKSYLMWNKGLVEDTEIFNAIIELSKGKIQPKVDTKLTDTREIMNKSKKKPHLNFKKK